MVLSELEMLMLVLIGWQASTMYRHWKDDQTIKLIIKQLKFFMKRIINDLLDLNFRYYFIHLVVFLNFIKLELNNVLNTNYQRFANFDLQGFQVLGGITYKFDF